VSLAEIMIAITQFVMNFTRSKYVKNEMRDFFKMRNFFNKYPASRIFVLWLLITIISAMLRAMDVYKPSGNVNIRFFSAENLVISAIFAVFALIAVGVIQFFWKLCRKSFEPIPFLALYMSVLVFSIMKIPSDINQYFLPEKDSLYSYSSYQKTMLFVFVGIYVFSFILILVSKKYSSTSEDDRKLNEE